MTNDIAGTIDVPDYAHGEIKVRHHGGREETVTVRLVGFRNVAKYLTLLGEIAPFIEYGCGKPLGWADTLDDDSVFAVDELIRKLNDDRVDRFIKRQIAAVEKINGSAKQINEATGGK